MPIKVNVKDNKSEVRVKTKFNDNVKANIGCAAEATKIEALIDALRKTKQNLGFIYLETFLDEGLLSGNIPSAQLNLLLSYLVNKVAFDGHVYSLVSISENSLYYACPDLELENNFIEVNKHNGYFEISRKVIDHSKLSNLDYLTSGHTGFAGIEFGTTDYWNSQTTYIPPQGMIVVYSDYAKDEQGKDIPCFKIGSGNDYLIDLPFIAENINEILEEHVNNRVIHITEEERTFWNKKINVRVNEEVLEFNND